MDNVLALVTVLRSLDLLEAVLIANTVYNRYSDAALDLYEMERDAACGCYEMDDPDLVEQREECDAAWKIYELARAVVCSRVDAKVLESCGRNLIGLVAPRR
jgi:hypothetical protein